MHKEEILLEIKRVAEENGGKSPSKTMFEEATTIKTHEWQKYWPRWSEAIKEAGLTPNQFAGTVYSDDALLDKLIEFTRELGRYPTLVEMRIKKINDPTFPHDCTIAGRLGNKQELIFRLLDYCRKRKLTDIIKILEPVSNTATIETYTINDKNSSYGFVYLAKGHRGEYKIGRTNLVDRRLSELGTKASIELELIHEIKTDDPVGVEAYWHKRFQNKHMKGEWFKLSTIEVKSFKKWRKIY